MWHMRSPSVREIGLFDGYKCQLPMLCRRKFLLWPDHWGCSALAIHLQLKGTFVFVQILLEKFPYTIDGMKYVSEPV